jgi:hypothetical protein
MTLPASGPITITQIKTEIGAGLTNGLNALAVTAGLKTSSQSTPMGATFHGYTYVPPSPPPPPGGDSGGGDTGG